MAAELGMGFNMAKCLELCCALKQFTNMRQKGQKGRK